ncbi:MAG: hypothetical protein CVU20_05020 [Betaproteobacteria bacterium HGW-Betaproteobacteria-14]|nr:MAG: hypothetical protein CVU20_05020 [Betaproteobacteria bacterium HGW-Betaproteobacteria-14]
MPDNPLAALRSRLADLFRWLRETATGKAGQDAEKVEAAGKCPPCAGRSERVADELRARGLPENLVAACMAGPLGPGDVLFVGRSDALDRLAAALDAWRGQQPMMVAVTGPQGCGITSLLRQIETALQPGEEVTYRALDARPYTSQEALAQCGAFFGLDVRPDSIEELVGQINALEPRFIVLDNGHFLACRIMGASEAIRTVGAVMVATQERHQWVLGCHLQAWQRLSHAHQADRYFAETIELKGFDKDELGAVIEARFDAAGFALTPPGEAPAEGDKRLLPEGRLTALQQLSRGLPDAAFFHLLRAIEPGADGDFALKDFAPFDYAALKTLSRAEMFALAEIAVHGTLTSAEHQALFRMREQESQMILQRLCGLCLLERFAGADGDARFRLVPVHAQAIATHLANANYLY